MKDVSEFKPGIYRHYKGGKYVALQLARHHDTGEPMVVYVCCERGTVSVREWDSPGKDSWCDSWWPVEGTVGDPLEAKPMQHASRQVVQAVRATQATPHAQARPSAPPELHQR